MCGECLSFSNEIPFTDTLSGTLLYLRTNNVRLYQDKQLLSVYDYNVLSRNEHRFLLAGLKVPKHSDWTARQAAYLSAVKEFLLKLNPDFSSIEVTFVKALNVGRKEDKRLFLSVDCKEVQQYVLLYMNKTIK